jgi:uncharacterized membrane protein YcaP (DUF421 family)
MDPMKLLEVVGRVVVIYAALLLLLRLAGRREMSELSPMDLLTMLLVSETVSPALTGGEESVFGGLIAAATLFGLTVVIARATFRSKRLERLVEGDPVLLVEDGRIARPVMKRFRITDAELATAIRENGVASVDDVERAYVEPDGKISVLEKRAKPAR